MIIRHNIFTSTKGLLTAMLFFSGIMACVISPCLIFASGSVNPVVKGSTEQIATFDEDEAAIFDSEPATNISPILYAEHYRPSASFPERQKRTVISNQWAPILPFAALATLALATARFFKRHRQKTGLTVQSPEGTCE